MLSALLSQTSGNAYTYSLRDLCDHRSGARRAGDGGHNPQHVQQKEVWTLHMIVLEELFYLSFTTGRA